jgi:hypothetical protein
MKTLFDTNGKNGKPAATMNRRDFLNLSCAIVEVAAATRQMSFRYS